YDVAWMHNIISARINCLAEFSRRGRDGLVAFHQHYFAQLERPLLDDVTREFDAEYAKAKQEVHRRSNRGQFRGHGGLGRRGRGRGVGGRVVQPARAAAAAGALAQTGSVHALAFRYTPARASHC
ncbi:hypothetical protein VaNZ11_004647, partial [Volvox africanus]